MTHEDAMAILLVLRFIEGAIIGKGNENVYQSN